MALLHFEGFEAYASSGQMGQQANTAGAGSISTSIVRSGARAYQVTADTMFRRLFTASGTTIIAGVGAYRQNNNNANMMIRLWSSSTSRTALYLTTDSVGQLQVFRGGPTGGAGENGTAGSGTLLWTNSESEPLSTWMHYELKVVLAATATGSWSLKRNGALVVSQSSVQTLENGADVVNAFISNKATGSLVNDFFIDDVYVCDGSGSANNDFLGPVRVAALRPTANDSVAMTPSSGANWQCVDETTPNDDTDYVSAPASGLPLTDRYTMSDLPAEASLIRGVRTLYRARKEDAALVELRGLVRSGGTDGLGTTRALDTAYTFYTDLFENDPNIGAAWTPTTVNAMTAGVRRVT
jgi:hypothetical protein